jgi:hypothetical protein
MSTWPPSPSVPMTAPQEPEPLQPIHVPLPSEYPIHPDIPAQPIHEWEPSAPEEDDRTR